MHGGYGRKLFICTTVRVKLEVRARAGKSTSSIVVYLWIIVKKERNSCCFFCLSILVYEVHIFWGNAAAAELGLCVGALYMVQHVCYIFHSLSTLCRRTRLLLS